MGKLGKTEFWVALAGIVATIGTATMQSGLLAPVPTAAAVVGIVVITATYIAGRSWEKAARAGRRPNVVFSPEHEPPPRGRSIRTMPPDMMER